MDEWIVLTEYNWAFWVAGLFALFEFFRWAYSGAEILEESNRMWFILALDRLALLTK